MHFAPCIPPDDGLLRQRQGAVGAGEHERQSRLLGGVVRQVLVGQKDNVVLSLLKQVPDDGGRVSGRAAVIRLGLHVGVGVHVTDDGRAGVLFAEHAHVFNRNPRRERAPGFLGRYQHRLLRVQNLGGLGHERTPQNTMISASVSAEIRESSSESPT